MKIVDSPNEIIKLKLIYNRLHLEDSTMDVCNCIVDDLLGYMHGGESFSDIDLSGGIEYELLYYLYPTILEELANNDKITPNVITELIQITHLLYIFFIQVFKKKGVIEYINTVTENKITFKEIACQL